MANGRFVKFALRVLLSVSALAGESAAQATFVVDFGIRGGAVATDSHQLVRMLRRRISLRRRFRVQSRTIARYDWADDRRSSPRPRGSAIRSSQASLWLPYRKRHDVWYV